MDSPTVTTVTGGGSQLTVPDQHCIHWQLYKREGRKDRKWREGEGKGRVGGRERGNGRRD